MRAGWRGGYEETVCRVTQWRLFRLEQIRTALPEGSEQVAVTGVWTRVCLWECVWNHENVAFSTLMALTALTFMEYTKTHIEPQ